MKIIANDYEATEVVKIIREWTEMTQEKFAESVHLSEAAVQQYETGRRRIPLNFLLDVAKEHGLKITIEK